MLPEANITSPLFHRNSSDLAIGGESLYRLSNAVLNQCTHPLFHRESQHLGGSRSSLDELFQVFRWKQQFAEGHSPLEAGSVTGFAASSTIETPLGTVLDAECGPVLRAIFLHQFVVLLLTRMIGLLALEAYPFAQALGEHSPHGVVKVE